MRIVTVRIGRGIGDGRITLDEDMYVDVLVDVHLIVNVHVLDEADIGCLHWHCRLLLLSIAYTCCRPHGQLGQLAHNRLPL